MAPRKMGTEIEDRLKRCCQKARTTTARHLKLFQNFDLRYSIMFGLRYHGVHGNTHMPAMAESSKNDAGFVRPKNATDIPTSADAKSSTFHQHLQVITNLQLGKEK